MNNTNIKSIDTPNNFRIVMPCGFKGLEKYVCSVKLPNEIYTKRRIAFDNIGITFLQTPASHKYLMDFVKKISKSIIKTIVIVIYDDEWKEIGNYDIEFDRYATIEADMYTYNDFIPKYLTMTARVKNIDIKTIQNPSLIKTTSNEKRIGFYMPDLSKPVRDWTEVPCKSICTNEDLGARYECS